MVIITTEKMEMDSEGLYHIPPSWTKKERKALCDLGERLIDTRPQLLKEAIAGSVEAIKTLRERFNMTCYIHKGVKII